MDKTGVQRRGKLMLRYFFSIFKDGFFWAFVVADFSLYILATLEWVGQVPGLLYLVILVVAVFVALVRERMSAPGPLDTGAAMRVHAAYGHEYGYGLLGEPDAELPDAYADLNLRIENTGAQVLRITHIETDLLVLSREDIPWWISETSTVLDSSGAEVSFDSPYELGLHDFVTWRVRLPLRIQLNVKLAKFATQLRDVYRSEPSARVRVDVEARAPDDESLVAGTHFKLMTPGLGDLYVARWQELGAAEPLQLAGRPVV